MEGDTFRRHSARLVSLLVRRLGPSHLELAEDAVQAAFLAALRVWPSRGEPENRAGWLATVAWREAIDHLRREGLYAPEAVEAPECAGAPWGVFDDAELEMLFLCCHPTLAADEQIALILRELCGLGTKEIAASLLTTESALYQRLVRAKRRLKEADLALPVHIPETRWESVLLALYLLFNEGYASHGDGNLISFELCDEAIQLVDRLTKTEYGDRPDAHALCGLMLLQSSRLATRLDANGLVCLLEDQDRSKWDRARISAGVRRLERACSGTRLSRYHVEAEIALQHAVAPNFEATNWTAVVVAYDDLVRMAPGPIVALNRAIAIGMRSGPAAGLSELAKLELDSNHHFFAARATMLEKRGCFDEAARDYRKALELASTEAERNWLRHKSDFCLRFCKE